MATMLLIVLAVCVATLVFSVRTWGAVRDIRRESGEALSIPRGKPKSSEEVALTADEIRQIAKACVATGASDD